MELLNHEARRHAVDARVESLRRSLEPGPRRVGRGRMRAALGLALIGLGLKLVPEAAPARRRLGRLPV